jgi:two-component system, sensor histidine kinase and response regulator
VRALVGRAADPTGDPQEQPPHRASAEECSPPEARFVSDWTGPQSTSRTVLVVDDEPDIRESLQEALGDQGYSVFVACNGKEALRLLPDLPRPCAVILDLIMPVMDGAELYAAMRATPGLADIPVLMSTSDTSRVPQLVPVMKKPVNLDRLLTAVAGLF